MRGTPPLYEVIVRYLPHKVADHDALAVGLAVVKDQTTYVQYVEVVFTGNQLIVVPDEPKRPLFWPAAIRWATDQLPALLRDETIPTPIPTMAYSLAPTLEQVRRYMSAQHIKPLPKELTVGMPAAEFAL